MLAPPASLSHPTPRAACQTVRLAAMAPQKLAKMKQVCTASPSKFAAALLDILDGSVEDPALPVAAPEEKPAKMEGKASTKKRKLAAVELEEDAPPTKKAKTTKTSKA